MPRHKKQTDWLGWAEAHELCDELNNQWKAEGITRRAFVVQAPDRVRHHQKAFAVRSNRVLRCQPTVEELLTLKPLF